MENKNTQSNTNSEINLDNLSNNINPTGVDLRWQGNPAGVDLRWQDNSTGVDLRWQDNPAQESAIWKLNSNAWDFEVDLRRTWTDNLSNMRRRYWRHNGLLIFLMIIIISVWVLFYKYDKYIVDYSNWIEDTDNKIADTYEKAKKKVYDLIWLEYNDDKVDTTVKLDNDNGSTVLKELIQSDNSYIYKKETLKISVKDLLASIINSTNHLDETKKHVSTYGFFSDKLSSIISDDEAISSIKDSLSAIESIKFSSAISVFSKLDTFIDRLAKETWLTKDEILTNIDEITKRWEKDINLFIKNCYLNASEIDYNCNNIWDFDKYYELTEDENFDTSFFKYLIQFVDSRLEQTDVPSFSIKFKAFNTQEKELTFDIEINTFKEDELELAKKWILSPHSFILNSLINNLKLSRVIVSEPIEVKSIKIEQRSIVFGTTEFTVNTSKKTFTVPIKKENQIEIDDFVY